MAGVTLHEVTKIYPGGIRAVDRVNLEIADREFVVLVGPSGCGKSTTLRMIAGLEGITAGTIQIGNRVVNDLAPKDRDIAMVFQNYALYPHMSVYKNMAFGLRLRGLPDVQIRQRVSDVARVLGIADLLDRKPPALSGGQRQRVAVGRAIVRNPAAFLFDEPLSNLDAKLRVTTRSELKRLHQRLQTTTVYVTHDQEEAMTLGDRIVVMKDGLIQQADAPLATYHSPANRFVAGFIGMPPMNFFDGVIMMVGGEMVFQEGTRSSDGRVEPSEQGFCLPLPGRLTGPLAARVGRHVVLGIRPEHLLTRPLDPPRDSAKVTFKVNVIEPLGNVVDVYMSTNLNDHVVARVEAESVQGGALTGGLRTDAPATLYADLRKVHVFEPGETGMNLSLTNEPAHAVA